MDFQGSSDPYCILEVENHRERSKVIKNTLNPTFDETFSFPITNGNEVLKVIVMDHDKGEADETDNDDF